MHLTLTGHHLELTPALRSYVEKRLERVVRHSDRVIDVHCTLTVVKLVQRAEATLHLRGETVHALAEHENMYASIDALTDKLERLARKHKEKMTDHHAAEAQKGLRNGDAGA
jgi:putative sigma-54 modulation protein